MREIKFRAWDKIKKCWIPLPRWKICYNDINTELMQYTGLKDKNGKEIYFGDIIQNNWFVNMKLIVGEFWVCQKLIDINGMNTPMEHIEIIGNIYENPKLLKESE